MMKVYEISGNADLILSMEIYCTFGTNKGIVFGRIMTPENIKNLLE